jgi:hypothetical protein
VPGWVSAPQAHSRVSNINFDIWNIFYGGGVSINIPWKIYQGRQSSCPLGVSIKGIIRAFNRLKCLGGFLHLKPTVGCPIIFFFKYQSWYLTPYCGLEVQKPTQALKSVKGPVNTFDWNPKWSRTLPSLIYFSWNIHKKILKYQSWYLTTYCGLEVQKPTQALQSVNGLAYTFDLNPTHSKLSNINFDIWICVYKHSMKNILSTAKFLPIWGFNQRYLLGL